MKKQFFSFMAGILAVCLCSCMPELTRPGGEISGSPASSVLEPLPSPEESLEKEEKSLTELTLPYNANEPLNPYHSFSARNHLLVPLLYDSLARPDRMRHPENQLAEEITMNGTNCIIKWRKDARFSDGSYLTGEDIVYSFQTAMAAGSPYQGTLMNVAGLTDDKDNDQVIAQLFSPDADFPLLLSFPIIKDGTGDNEFPVGISKFHVTGAHNTGVILGRNPIYYGKQPPLETIRLVHATDDDTLHFGMNTGEFDLLYTDLSTESLSGVSAPSISVPTNYLVYIGINGRRGLLARPEFRHSLSLALNRAEIAMTAYANRVRPAVYPFHPDFYRLSETEIPARNLTSADALLDGLGLTEKDGNGYRIQNGQPIFLRLLVNSENSARSSAATLVCEQLAQIGIRVEVVSGDFQQYQNSLQTGAYDLYIGETRLMDNHDFTPLLSGGALGYSTAYSEELEQRLSQYRETGEIAPLCEMFLAQSPFLPLAYREGLLYMGRSITVSITPTQQDLFYNILEW